MRNLVMTMPVRPLALLTSLLVAGGLLAAVPARGQGSPTGEPMAPPAAGDPRLPTGGAASAPTFGGNYDYFTAHLQGGLATYLSIMTTRHASERVWALFWEGKYSEPLGDCEYVLARFPNHPRALHLLGEIAKATNQVSLGISYFENAIARYPQYAFTHAQYGHYLIEVGAVPAGVGQLREALRLDPNQFQAKAWLAKALAANPALAKGEDGSEPGERADDAKAGTPKGSR